ncbi:MAG: hypothetical protein JXA57_05785, partial [Armatimonadetes bacterium]|nr:hypothetical protein [Armatimonadota bacterium]
MAVSSSGSCTPPSFQIVQNVHEILGALVLVDGYPDGPTHKRRVHPRLAELADVLGEVSLLGGGEDEAGLGGVGDEVGDELVGAIAVRIRAAVFFRIGRGAVLSIRGVGFLRGLRRFVFIELDVGEVILLIGSRGSATGRYRYSYVFRKDSGFREEGFSTARPCLFRGFPWA